VTGNVHKALENLVCLLPVLASSLHFLIHTNHHLSSAHPNGTETAFRTQIGVLTLLEIIV